MQKHGGLSLRGMTAMAGETDVGATAMRIDRGSDSEGIAMVMSPSGKDTGHSLGSLRPMGTPSARRWRAAFIVVTLFVPVSSHAADRAVRLVPAPSLRPGVVAMPLIADPTDEAEQRINAALRRLDTMVCKAVADCRTYAGRLDTWRRTV